MPNEGDRHSEEDADTQKLSSEGGRLKAVHSRSENDEFLAIARRIGELALGPSAAKTSNELFEILGRYRPAVRAGGLESIGDLNAERGNVELARRNYEQALNTFVEEMGEPRADIRYLEQILSLARRLKEVRLSEGVSSGLEIAQRICNAFLSPREIYERTVENVRNLQRYEQQYRDESRTDDAPRIEVWQTTLPVGIGCDLKAIRDKHLRGVWKLASATHDAITNQGGGAAKAWCRLAREAHGLENPDIAEKSLANAITSAQVHCMDIGSVIRGKWKRPRLTRVMGEAVHPIAQTLIAFGRRNEAIEFVLTHGYPGGCGTLKRFLLEVAGELAVHEQKDEPTLRLIERILAWAKPPDGWNDDDLMIKLKIVLAIRGSVEENVPHALLQESKDDPESSG